MCSLRNKKAFDNHMKEILYRQLHMSSAIKTYYYYKYVTEPKTAGFTA